MTESVNPFSNKKKRNVFHTKALIQVLQNAFNVWSSLWRMLCKEDQIQLENFVEEVNHIRRKM